MNNQIMLKLIESFPNLVESGYSLTDEKVKFKPRNIKNIIYAGMGGSALAGDVIKELSFQFSSIPFEVVRNYNLPHYADERTLLVISSFSGDTEETIECMKDGIKKKAKIVSISSGGAIERLSKKNKTDYIKIPVSMPPRTAFGMTLFALLKKLKNVFANEEFDKMTEDALKMMKSYSFDYVSAKELAGIMKNRIPIFYSDTSFSSAVRRCANQVSENSKQFAHFNLIPEMNHNEIVGMMKPANIQKNVVIMFIEFRQDNIRNRKRMVITKEILHENKFDCVTIGFESDNILYNIIDCSILFDLASYYLALENRVNSVEVKRINILKSRIKK